MWFCYWATGERPQNPIWEFPRSLITTLPGQWHTGCRTAERTEVNERTVSMGYFTRVLSKDPEFPSFDEIAGFVRSEHPDYKVSIEEGDEDEWESLLLSGNDEVEVALL